MSEASGLAGAPSPASGLTAAYVTTYDSTDVRQWSGLGYFIAESVRRHVAALERVGPLVEPLRRLTLAKKATYRLLGRQYLRERATPVLREYARQVEEKLRAVRADIVLSPGSLPIAYVRSERPLAFWTDATFAAMLGFYPGYERVCRESEREGDAAERAALDRCALAIYSSDWAARSAVERYGADPAKVHVVPYGPNLAEESTAAEVTAAVDGRPEDRCRLLFVGVDWSRKGGDLAVDVARRLNARGLETELVVVGASPPRGVALPPYVTPVGFLSKASRDGAARLRALFSSAHFLVLPSRAECCAVVLAEASSFGVPCLASDVGGIPTAVTDRNGRTFSLEDGAEPWVDFVIDTLGSRGRYRQLALSAFEEYRTRLNWDTAAAKVAALLARASACSR